MKYTNVNIPLKFMPCEEVWLLHVDRICCARVKDVWIDATVSFQGLGQTTTSQVIKYILTSWDNLQDPYPTADPVYEQDLFATEQKLIDFLKRDL